MLEAIFLYVILHDDNSNGERFRTQMPSMEVCQKSLESAKMSQPKKVGGDYEVMSVIFCGTGKFNRHFNGTWWNDPTKG
jgi:hypothetical protein